MGGFEVISKLESGKLPIVVIATIRTWSPPNSRGSRLS